MTGNNRETPTDCGDSIARSGEQSGGNEARTIKDRSTETTGNSDERREQSGIERQSQRISRQISINKIPEIVRLFDLRHVLGAGAFGTVWAALDRERRRMVALKVLNQVNATVLYSFKQEFRALADIVHPNLVALHELFCIQGCWFFTMDLVKGLSFNQYVRGEDVSDAAMSSEPSAADAKVLSGSEGSSCSHSTPDKSRGRGLGFDEARLRASLTQLARGVVALHEEGK